MKKKKNNDCDINKNIRFFINLHLYHYLLKFNLIRLLLKPGPGPRKTWTLKNMEYMGLKIMSDFRELCFNKIYVSTHKMKRANSIDQVSKFV